jgi:hypothetical protein
MRKDGQTDRHDEDDSRFCNLANAPKRGKEASLVRSHAHSITHCDFVTNCNVTRKYQILITITKLFSQNKGSSDRTGGENKDF